MTVFVFIEQWHERQERLSEVFTVVQEQPEYQVQEMTLAELVNLAYKGAEFWLVMSGSLVSLHTLELPKLGRKDILPAIRSSLEEQLVQDYDEYHCFYKSSLSSKTLDLVVGFVDKKILESVVYQFQDAGIVLSGMTIDWFALQKDEVLILSSEDALVYIENCCGWIPRSLVKAKLCEKSGTRHFLTVNKTNLPISKQEPLHLPYFIWIVTRLRQQGLFDILMRHHGYNLLDKLPKARVEFYTVKGVFGLCVLSFIFFVGLFSMNLYRYWQNQKVISSYSTQATGALEYKLKIYQQQQLLKNKFWKVFIALQRAYLPSIKITNLSYAEDHLHLSLSSGDMLSFQKFKQGLSLNNVRIQETQVVVQGTGVKANLDLRMI